MNKDIFHKISEFYNTLVDRHGHSVKACDYGRAESQLVKFRVLSEVMPLDGESILDIGCGFADFSDYLRSKYTNIHYTGLDISPKMIHQARLLHPDLDLRLCNILHEKTEMFNVVTANGIFYLLGENAYILMQNLIVRMFETARYCVAFNSLSSWSTDKEKNEYYADPADTLTFCRTLTSRIVLRHDYHTRDFTIYLYKEPCG